MSALSDKTSIILWLLLGLCCLAAPAARAELSFGDELVASIPMGLGPGEFYFMEDSTGRTRPWCFTVDGKGCIYVPEVYDGIRIHKFEPSGEFTVMLGVQGPQNDVTMVAVGPAGEIYLVTYAPNSGGSVANKYTREGELLLQLGKNGVLSPKQLSQGYFNNPNAYHGDFFWSVTQMVADESGNVLVKEGNNERPKIHTFNSKGAFLQTSTAFPPRIAERMEQHRVQHQRFEEALGKKRRMTYTYPGPDGAYYYMAFGEEGLEIHRVTFPQEQAAEVDPGSTKE